MEESPVMTADMAADILKAYFKKQCGFGLSYVKIDGFVPHQDTYAIIAEHRCMFEEQASRHEIIMRSDGSILAIKRTDRK